MITFGIEIITPEEAKQMLRGKNRHVRTTAVTRYARDMREARWVENGETVKIDINGDLIDGQHRLLAIIEASVPISLLVVRGLQPVAQETVDTGDRRRLADVLGLRGEPNAFVLAGGTRMAWMMAQPGGISGTMGGAWPTQPELIEYFEQNPGLQESAYVGNNISRSILRLSPSAATALYYHMSQKDPAAVNEFWQGAVEGTGLKKGDPRLTLRETLIRDAQQQRRANLGTRMAWCIKAWNAFRKNTPMFTVRWSRVGGAAEDFPQIK